MRAIIFNKACVITASYIHKFINRFSYQSTAVNINIKAARSLNITRKFCGADVNSNADNNAVNYTGLILNTQPLPLLMIFSTG